MNDQECKRYVAEQLRLRVSLSDIQKALAAEHGLRMTYLDLRLLAADLDVDWKSLEPVKPVAPPDPDGDLTGDGEAGHGGTRITVSKLVRPGAAMSGDVRFASGAKAEWFVDSMGRLGLNPEPGSSQPTQDDIHEFQVELQNKLAGMG